MFYIGIVCGAIAVLIFIASAIIEIGNDEGWPK